MGGDVSTLRRANLTAEQNARLPADVLRAPALHRSHKLPRWLQRRLRAIPDNELGYRSYHGSWLVEGADWLDHWGYYVAPDGRQVFVSEPYHVGTDALTSALLFARQAGAELRVSPVSSHYPGWTIRLEFWPPASARVAA